MTRPDGGQGAQAARRLNVSDESDSDQRRALQDGDGLDDVLLVELGTRLGDGTDDVGQVFGGRAIRCLTEFI